MHEASAETSWLSLDLDRAPELVGARLAMHWAAQLPAAAGATLVPARDDYSHTALTWIPEVMALVTEPLELALGSPRVGLRLRDLALILVTDETVAASYPLAGRTFLMGLQWLAQRLGAALLERPPHELPAHAVERGETFAEQDAAALAQLEAWFANAHHVLREVAVGDGWSPLRCWPHHFDIATLKSLEPGVDPEKARSIGMGMSPGDGSYQEPYFYVNPWPAPSAPEAEPLRHGGAWHTEGWTGAVLPAGRIDADSQARQVRGFLESAIGAAARVLGSAD